MKLTNLFLILFLCCIVVKGYAQPVENVPVAYQINYSKVVLLTFEEPNKSCSGALIGNFAVLTAGHCLRSPKTSREKIPQTITAHVGGLAGNLKAKGNKIYLLPLLAESRTGINQLNGIADSFRGNDVGILILDKPVGKNNHFANVKTDYISPEKEVVVIGFPNKRDKQRPWFSAGKVLKNTPTLIMYSADVSKGNSGSPVLQTNDLDTIIAVHEGEESDDSPVKIATKTPAGILEKFVQQHRNGMPSGVSNASPADNTTAHSVISALTEKLRNNQLRLPKH